MGWGKIKNGAWRALLFLGGALMFVAQVSPSDATSRIAAWVEWGTGYLPAWPHQVDAWVTGIGAVLFLLPVGMWVWQKWCGGPDNKMHFGEVVQHVAFKSKWALAFRPKDEREESAWSEALVNEICRPLANGTLVATGIRRQRVSRNDVVSNTTESTIPASDWNHAIFPIERLVLDETPRSEDYSMGDNPNVMLTGREKGAPYYLRIKFDRRAVERIWKDRFWWSIRRRPSAFKVLLDRDRDQPDDGISAAEVALFQMHWELRSNQRPVR